MLALDIHREADFDVPRHWRCEFKGMPALAVERFDRDADNTPLCSESLYSILSSGVSLNNNYDYRYDLIAQALDITPVNIVDDIRSAKQHLFKRLIMALLTGNGDLHLENMSITLTDNVRGFSKIYDPAPMRAYAQHDMLSVMPFGNYGETLEGLSEPVNFKQAVKRFARSCGLNNIQAAEMIGHLLSVTENFNSRVDKLETVPDENKQRLIDRTESVRKKLNDLV